MRRFAIVCVVCATASLSFAQAPPYDQQTDEQAPPDEAPSPAQHEVEVAPQPDQYSDTDPSALSDFRAPLAPYGNWVDDPTYGTVWIPHRTVVGDSFVPYQSAGHWAMDGANYVWMSDYSWGWLPFHYGRWVFIDGTGWAWIPGRAYAPSWVDWSVGDDYDYVGWYPTPPDFIWWAGAAVGLAAIPAVDFFYCPTPFLFDANVHRHIIVGAQAQQIHLHARTLPAIATMRRGAFERGYVRGPALSRLGAIRVVHAHPDQRQLALAQRYSTPATAKAAGASAPSAHRVKVPSTRARQAAPYSTTPREAAPPETTPRTPAPEQAAPHTPLPPDMRPRNPPRAPPRMSAPPGSAPQTRTPTPEPRATPSMPTPPPEHTPLPEQTHSPTVNREPPPMPPDRPSLPERTPSPVPTVPSPVQSVPPAHSAPPPVPSEPPVHSAPPIPSPPPSPPVHRAPASQAPTPSAPDPTPSASPASPAPSSSEPGVFDSAAGIARS